MKMTKEEAIALLACRKVRTNGRCAEIQRKIFQLGGCWQGGNTTIRNSGAQFLFFYKRGNRIEMTYTLECDYFLEHTNTEISAEEILAIEVPYVPMFGDIVRANFNIPSAVRDYMICIMPYYFEEGYDGAFNIANVNLGGDVSYSCGSRNLVDIQPASFSEMLELIEKLQEKRKKWDFRSKNLVNI